MYVIKIGQHGYFKSDDRPPVSAPNQATPFPDYDSAEEEAVVIRETWNLKPKGGATPAVKVVTL